MRKAIKSVEKFKPAFEDFARKVQPDIFNPMSPPDEKADETECAMAELASTLGVPVKSKVESAHALSNALLSDGVRANEAIRAACLSPVEGSNREVKAANVPAIDRRLFGGSSDGIEISDAMRGLLLALGMSRKPGDNTSPQPLRGHFFFHNMQNLWVCSNYECDEPLRILSAEKGGDVVPVGALHAEHRLTCSCGGRVLDLIVCGVCGDIFLGGYRNNIGSGREILTADMPDIENMPDKMFKHPAIWQLCDILAE